MFPFLRPLPPAAPIPLLERKVTLSTKWTAGLIKKNLAPHCLEFLFFKNHLVVIHCTVLPQVGAGTYKLAVVHCTVSLQVGFFRF